MLRALRVALPVSWVLALLGTLVFARSAVLPILILGALVVSAWWAAFGAALGSRGRRGRWVGSWAGSAPLPDAETLDVQSARNSPPSTGSIAPDT
jgi:hypothetical protein